MIKLGAGWNNYSETGAYVSYEFDEAVEGMTVDLSKVKFLSYENREKKEETQPDWHLFLAKKRNKQ